MNASTVKVEFPLCNGVMAGRAYVEAFNRWERWSKAGIWPVCCGESVRLTVWNTVEGVSYSVECPVCSKRPVRDHYSTDEDPGPRGRESWELTLEGVVHRWNMTRSAQLGA